MEALRYVPYFDLGGVPNVIADGHPRRSTVLTLSHWPRSTTPEVLRRDLSAEIALAYLEHPELHVDAAVVSNNHLDLDGFLSVWTLTHPDAALADPHLVAEVARAGDFGWTHDRRAARLAFALGTMKTASTSPLPPEVFAAAEPHRVAALYQALLPSFLDLVRDVDDRVDLWGDQERALEAAEDALRRGQITVQEHPELDLAVVDVDPAVAGGTYPYCLQHQGPCHPMAVHRATDCSRVLYRKGDWSGLVFRFESWVDFRSRWVPPRVDLRGLARELTDRDAAAPPWRFGWPNDPNPPVAWLCPDGASTSIPPEDVEAAVIEHLATGSPIDGGRSGATYS